MLGAVALALTLLSSASGARGAQSVASWETLPAYQPGAQVNGTIRNVGFGLGGVLKAWEDAFVKLQPGVRFEDKLITSDDAIPALVSGTADLGPDGGEPIITEALSFFETYGHPLSWVVVATGAYDVEGRSNGMVVYVNQANPLERVTMAQLDGIFGAARTGAIEPFGFVWEISAARGADKDIRRWGQLGLTGAWANKPIQSYGHAPSGTSRFFQLHVLHNSDKWNPNYREYVESGSKMIGADDPHQLGGLRHMLGDELAHDPYGIAWTVAPQAKGISGIKPLAIAERDGGPYVMPSRESFANRTYPLARNIYIYLNRDPGKPVEPKLREFLRFILSRDGQAIVDRDGNYLALPASSAREQVAKLE